MDCYTAIATQVGPKALQKLSHPVQRMVREVPSCHLSPLECGELPEAKADEVIIVITLLEEMIMSPSIRPLGHKGSAFLGSGLGNVWMRPNLSSLKFAEAAFSHDPCNMWSNPTGNDAALSLIVDASYLKAGDGGHAVHSWKAPNG